MKKFTFYSLFWIIALIVPICLQGQEYLGTTHARSQFENNANSLVFQSMKASGSEANVSFIDNTSIMNIVNTGFNSALVEFEFASVVDLTKNGFIQITYKTQDWIFSNPTDWGGNLKFVLVDEFGANTGYEWNNGGGSSHFRWGAWGEVPVPPTGWTTLSMSFEGSASPDFDYTAIKKLQLINRYHNGDWGGGHITGKFIAKQIIVGEPNSAATATHASMNFNDGDLSAGVVTAIINKNAEAATAADGAAKVSVDNSGFNDVIAEIELTKSVDLTDGAPFYIQYKTENWIFDSSNGFFKFVLVDGKGKNTGYDWNHGGATSHFRWTDNVPPVDYIRFMCHFEGSDDAGFDYTDVKKVLLVSRYHDGSWGGGTAKMNGTLIINEFTLGFPTASSPEDLPRLTWSYFHNPFEGTDLNNEQQTMVINEADGVSAAQADGHLVLTLTSFPSYKEIFRMNLASTIDVSTSSNLIIKVKVENFSRDGGIEGGQNKLVWYLIDDKGNSTKPDGWQTEMGVNYSEFTEITLNMASVPQSCDLTKIKAIAVRSQSADASWGTVNINATITFDDLKLGKIQKAISQIGKTWFETAFTEIDGLDDANQTTSAGVGTRLDQSGGVLNTTLENVAASAPIFTIDLKQTINLKLAQSADFSLKILPTLAQETTFLVSLYDQAGKSSVKQEIVLHDTEVLLDSVFEPGEADMSTIKKIVFYNGTTVASGTLIFDDLKVGHRSEKLVLEPRTLTIAGKLDVDVIIDGIAEPAVWDDVDPIVLDRLIWWNAAYSVKPEPENISGFFKIFYTADSLYILVDVTDDSNSPIAGTQPGYLYDNIEIYINPDTTNDQASGAYGADAVQLSFNRKTESQSGKGVKNGINYSYALTEKAANGYVGEFAISLADLKIPAKEDYAFGFELSVTDADLGVNNDQRTRKIIWNMDLNNDIAWQNTNVFGTAIMGAVPEEVVTVTIESVQELKITVGLSTDIDGMTTDNFVVTLKESGVQVPVKSITTSDNGSTYVIESRYPFTKGTEYVLTTSKLGYDFGDPITFIGIDATNVHDLRANMVKVYPNPATDRLVIEAVGIQSIMISDIKGSMLLHQKHNSDQVILSIADLPKGILVITIISEKNALVYKIIKD